MKLLGVLFSILVSTLTLTAQVVYTDPVFPTQDGTVTIYFDATQGNGALEGVSPPIFAHTGVVTNESATPTSWLHVQGAWGTYDEDLLMTEEGDNLYSITYNIADFYGFPSDDTVYRMGFVFRNEDGSIVGREADGSDIFIEVYEPGLNVAVLSPAVSPFIVELDDEVPITVASLDAVSMDLYIDDVLITSTASSIYDYTHVADEGGLHWVKVIATDGIDIIADSTSFFVRPPVTVAELPDGIDLGINYIDDNTVTLALYAPFKEYAFAIGDHSDWQVNEDVYMNRTPDGETYWVTLSGLDAGVEYGYQYLVDGTLRPADPFAEKLLDPANDAFISEDNYPDLKEYPAGKTTGFVSIFQTAQEPYVWAVPDFTPVPNEKLVVYELLVRDFLSDRSYNSLIDTLDYLDRMGINAIELMPIMEYEGNDSWGYNPIYFTALDKYYGTREAFKTFVDSCHARGIAVILDIALNHAFGQCPLVWMWWDAEAGTPSAENPYFNQIPKHDFNVGFDFNHDSPATIYLRNRVFKYWLEEYNVDGYRFDLSKGFTQNNTLGDVGAWGAYDANRIQLWKDVADTLWAVNENALLILEHFADNSEEKELANYGFMVWGNMNHNYGEAAMGWGNSTGNSSLYWASYQNRDWNDPHAMVYAESHDEERLMYKNITFGNSSNSDHDCKDFYIALERMEAVAVFLMAIPGPKMLWQFGELGYDYSIDFNCRVCPKPVRWDYLEESGRYRLYQIYSAMINLKTSQDAFNTEDFVLDGTGAMKRVNLNHPGINFTILGNFQVTADLIDPHFQHEGWWYDYFSGDSVYVENVNSNVYLDAGTYRVFSDVRLDAPEIITDLEDSNLNDAIENIAVFPNPSSDHFTFSYTAHESGNYMIEIFDINGSRIHEETVQVGPGYQTYTWYTGNLESGVYLAKVQLGNTASVLRLVIQ